MNYVIWLIIGLVLGTALLLYARARGRNRQKRILSIGLVVAAIIYVGFALLWGNPMWIAVEVAGVLAYGIFVWLALRYSINWLAAGWAVHPAWDVILHLLGPGHAIVPEWYAVACISFDFLVASYVLICYKSRRSKVPESIGNA